MQAGVTLGLWNAGVEAGFRLQPVVQIPARDTAALEVEMMSVVADVILVFRFEENGGGRFGGHGFNLCDHLFCFYFMEAGVLPASASISRN